MLDQLKSLAHAPPTLLRDAASASMYFDYQCTNTSRNCPSGRPNTGAMLGRHQVWYDDADTLRMKCEACRTLGVLGVGVYAVDFVSYDVDQGAANWAALSSVWPRLRTIDEPRLQTGDVQITTRVGGAADAGRPAAAVPLPFHDGFDRPDGRLGESWTEGYAATGNYSCLGIHNHAAAMVAPTIRNGTYAAPCQYNVTSGTMLAGIGCAWRDFQATSARVSVRWSGLMNLPHHIEAGPLLHITPTTQSFGIGIWPSFLYGRPMFFVGTIGNPGGGVAFRDWVGVRMLAGSAQHREV